MDESTIQLMTVLLKFVSSATWAEAQAVVEQHPELLSDKVDAFFEEAIAGSGGIIERMIPVTDSTRVASEVESLRRRHRLLQRCREIGVGAAFAELDAPRSTEKDFRPRLFEFAAAESRRQARRMIEDHPELLNPRALDTLQSLIEEARGRVPDDAIDELQARMRLLRRCIENGTAAAFEQDRSASRQREAVELLLELMASPLREWPRMLLEHPELLGDDAAHALETMIASARADGEHDLAAKLDQLRTLLQQSGGLRAELLGEEEPGGRESGPASLASVMIRFVDADSWAASERIVEEHPELLTEAADELISSLVEQAERDDNDAVAEMSATHRQVLRRCREIGIARAFEELGPPGEAPSVADVEAKVRAALDELDESGAPDEAKFALRAQTALMLLSRHRATGARDDLDGSIRWWRELTQVAPATSPNCPHNFNQLGIALAARYALTKELGDLDGAVAAHRDAVAACPDGFEDLPGLIANLGNVLMDRHDHTGERAGLDQAINTYDDAVKAAGKQADNLAGLLGNLAEGLRKRFDLLGGADDLDGAIDALRRAITASPPGFPHLLDAQNNLGVCLVDRFERQGDVADLDQAIGIYQSTIPQLSQQPRDLSTHLTNFGNAWRRRYRHDHEPSSLEQAITAYRRAAAVAPRSSDLTEHLMNLANALIDRYKRFSEITDLNDAVQAYEGAVAASPRGHHLLPGLLNALGNALSDRWGHIGDAADLEAALEAQQEAVDKTPLDSDDLPGHMSTLGNRHLDRYRHCGDAADLNAAVDWYRRAVDVAPADSPELPGWLNNLSLGLRTRYDLLGDRQDLDGAVHSQALAVSATSEDSKALPVYLASWGGALARRYQRTGDLADLQGAIAAFGKAVKTVSKHSPDRPEFLAGLAHSLRLRYGNTRERADLDEAIVLYRKALAATPPEAPERVGQLSSLANTLSDRYDEDHRLSDLDQAIDLHRQARDLTPERSPDRPGRSSNLGGSLANRFERTGSREDLDEAIRLFEEAVDRTPEGAPSLPGLENNLAMGLRHRYALDGHAADPRAAVEHYERSCRLGLESDPRAALVAATRWSQWATERQAWNEAVHAFGYGLKAAKRLVGRQFSRGEKETWLRLTKSLAPAAAYAHTMNGDPQGAVVALERGRAVLLAEALEPGSGQTVPALAFEAIAAEAQRAPLVYIAATAAGGVALIVGQDGAVEHELLPDLTLTALRDQGARYFAAYVAMREATDELERERSRLRWNAALDDLGQWLWQHVMSPVLDALPAAAEIVLIPGGYLGLLPLHAAWAVDASEPTGRRYALDRVRVSYSASARALASARRMAADIAPDSILIVEQPLPVTAPPLPNAAVEATAIRLAFTESLPLRAKDPLVRLRHHHATRGAVRTALARCAVLHLCCHGFADAGEPMSGGLLMAGDEVLTVRDVMRRRDTPARLAVLSACETSMPGADLPDEVLGLPTALIEAGVAGVIGSLWVVPDLSTAVLMTRLYELWRTDGLDPCEALRQAQRWLRDCTNAQLAERCPQLFREERLQAADLTAWEAERPFASPNFWAAFTYTGA